MTVNDFTARSQGRWRPCELLGQLIPKQNCPLKTLNASLPDHSCCPVARFCLALRDFRPTWLVPSEGPRLRSAPGRLELPLSTMLKRGHRAVPDSRQRPKLTQSTTLAIDTLACVCSCPVLGPIHEWRLHSKLGRQPLTHWVHYLDVSASHIHERCGRPSSNFRVHVHARLTEDHWVATLSRRPGPTAGMVCRTVRKAPSNDAPHPGTSAERPPAARRAERVHSQHDESDLCTYHR